MSVSNFSQRKIDRSLRASEIGVLATGTLFATTMVGLPLFVGAIAYVLALGSVILLYRNRKQDEFLEKHWNAGATTAFFAICLWGLLAPFTIGVFDGVTGNDQGRDAAHILASGVLPIALIAFFAAFQLSRLRNG